MSPREGQMGTGPRIECSWNDGWAYRPFQSSFLELAGTAAPWQPVTLPHDAMLSEQRDGSQADRAGVAYFPDGAWEYKKSLLVPEEWRDRRVLLEFDGVYRGAIPEPRHRGVGDATRGHRPQLAARATSRSPDR